MEDMLKTQKMGQQYQYLNNHLPALQQEISFYAYHSNYSLNPIIFDQNKLEYLI